MKAFNEFNVKHIIYELYTKYGLKMEDIAKLFGMSQSEIIRCIHDQEGGMEAGGLVRKK